MVKIGATGLLGFSIIKHTYQWFKVWSNSISLAVKYLAHINQLNIFIIIINSLQVQCFVKEKREELLANQSGCKNYQFDFFFEKSLKEREEVLPQLQTSLSDSDSDEGDVVNE